MSWQEYDYEVPRPGVRFGPKLTPVVKGLIVSNVVVFVLQTVTLDRTGVSLYFCLVPRLLLRKAFAWQLLTYMFLHGSTWHLLLNMVGLWMFGSDIESRLGARRFVGLYFLSGVGAGLCYAATSWGARAVAPMLGASGALFGVLISFAMLFPDRLVMLMLPFPLTVKAKHAVLGFAFLEILSVISAARDNVAHFAHLGGLAFGYVYMKAKFQLALPYAFAERFSSAFKRLWHSRKAAKYKYRPIDVEEFISREVDPILAKISQYGIGSLTRREKRILKKARSQMK
jgi:membrane associated rhomboid family serine protease